MRRLTDALDGLPGDIGRPSYDRSRLGIAIVHLGIGAFARAHLAAVNETTLQATGDLRWGIAGVSLRHADTRAALAPQAGLYTLALRDAAPDGGVSEALRVIGCLRDVSVAPEDPVAVLERIAANDTRIVSLTVTEKGYCHDPATGRLRFDDPDIAHDLGAPDAPRSTIGLLVHGLNRRRQRWLGPITLQSCENLPSNGRTLRGLVLGFAARIDPKLADWIGDACTFPNSMVDRIVPRTTDADRAHIAARLGCMDCAPVVGEPFLDWVIEDRFAAGRPAWDLGGARFVDDAAPFERMKLRMLNGSHSALAYLGATAGLQTIDRAVGVPGLRNYVDAMMRREIAPTLPVSAGLDPTLYAERLLARFANPALRHRTHQIAMDGSQKLPQRLLDSVRDRLAADAPIDRLALAIAGWIRFLRGVDEQGDVQPIDDPLRDALAVLLAQADAAAGTAGGDAAAERRRIDTVCRFAPVFGALGEDPRFVEAVARQAFSLRTRGVLASVERAIG
jgi:fructuronate reductase